MVRAGVLKSDDGLRGFRLHVALERTLLPLRDRDELAIVAATFRDLINSYGGVPDAADMIEAKALLERIGAALVDAVDATIKKRGWS